MDNTWEVLSHVRAPHLLHHTVFSVAEKSPPPQCFYFFSCSFRLFINCIIWKVWHDKSHIFPPWDCSINYFQITGTTATFLLCPITSSTPVECLSFPITRSCAPCWVVVIGSTICCLTGQHHVSMQYLCPVRIINSRHHYETLTYCLRNSLVFSYT